MDRGKGGNLVSGDEAPGDIFNRVPPDSLFRPDNVNPEGVVVFPECNPQCWAYICATGGGIGGIIYPRPVRG